MMTPFFSNDNIRLRAMEPEDLELLYTLENDPQTWSVSNFTVPYSKHLLQQYIDNSDCDMFADRQLRLMIVRREDDTVVGTIDIFDFVPMHARGEVGVTIRKEYQRHGYAREALELLCNYAFLFLHLKQLTAHIAIDNTPSIRLFESCGFIRCGVLKEWWKVGGEYKDVAMMQRLR